jgi:Fungal specific transcription factor domain
MTCRFSVSRKRQFCTLTVTRHQIYFQTIHPALPIIHRPRYFAAMDLAPNMRPPVCLRYAMWTHVCSVTPRYSALADHFYARARKYAEQDEIRGYGESIITVAHSQCWSLIASYEFKMMYFPRAWMSVGRATRLSQMLNLHRQDGAALDVKQALPPPRDWTEREERRRTFWMAFCQDRYASVGTGWPMTIDERDVCIELYTSRKG